METTVTVEVIERYRDIRKDKIFEVGDRHEVDFTRSKQLLAAGVVKLVVDDPDSEPKNDPEPEKVPEPETPPVEDDPEPEKKPGKKKNSKN